MASSRWTLERKIKRNHKWYSCNETGRIACADYSGRYPDETDDGILWLNKEKPIVMGDDSGRIWICTPVIKSQTDGESHIISGLAEMLYLVREHGMELQVRPGGDNELALLIAKSEYQRFATI